MLNISVDESVFKNFMVCSGILMGKMLAMTLLTSKQRYTKRIFANPEDATTLKNSVIKFDDEDVERIRRAHRNDMENIPVWVVSAFLYILSNPNPVLAIGLLRLFVGARVVHTFVYAVKVMQQPARALSFTLGYCINWYMLIQGIRRFI